MSEKKYCDGCNHQEGFIREFAVVHEEINGRFASVERDVREIKEDIVEIKTAMTANSSNITNLIKKLDGDKQFQMWALGIVIGLCCAFGGYLADNAFKNTVAIERIRLEHMEIKKDFGK